MCHCDFEQPAIYKETKRKARKLHICHECEQSIEPGTEYVRISGCWEGQFAHIKMCLLCHEVKRLMEQQDLCFAFGELYSVLEDCLGIQASGPEKALAQITPKGRALLGKETT